MSPEEQKAVIRRYVDTVFNRQQLNRADECVAPDFIEATAVVVGIETDRGPWVQALIAAGHQIIPAPPRVPGVPFSQLVAGRSTCSI